MMSHTKKWTGALLLGVILAASPMAPGAEVKEARAQQGADDSKRDLRAERARIQRLLSAHHELPDKIFFERASQDARSLLFDFATDLNIFPLYRYRALEALGLHYGDDHVLDLYSKVLATPSDFGAHHRVMMYAASFFGEQATALLAPMTSSKDAQLRRTAYEALLVVGSEGAMATLERARAREDDPLLLARLDEVLITLR